MKTVTFAVLWILVSATGAAIAQTASAPEAPPVGTPITLHVQNAPASEVLAQLRKQMDLPASAADPAAVGSWPAVTLDVDKQPFWTVLTSVDDQLHKTILLKADGSLDTTLERNPPFPGMRQVSGRFLFTLEAIEFGITSPGPHQLTTGRATLTIRAEPTLNVLQFGAVAKMTAAVDDLGHSLLTGAPESSGRQKAKSDSPYSFPTQVVIRLQKPADAGARIARLEGTVSAFVPGPMKSLEIADTKQITTHPWGAGALRVNGLRKTGDKAYQTEVYAQDAADTRTPGPARKDLETLFFGATADVLDDAGTPMYATAYSDDNGRLFIKASQTDPTGKGPETHPPAKIVIHIPQELKEIKAPFSFKNITLP